MRLARMAIAAVAVCAPLVLNAGLWSTTADVLTMSEQQVWPGAVFSCSRSIPADDCQAAVHVYEFIVGHNLSPPTNYVGGAPFRNDHGDLPSGDYKEYDIYPKPPPGRQRDSKRIVVDVNDVSKVWFTPDHYKTFIAFGYGSG